MKLYQTAYSATMWQWFSNFLLNAVLILAFGDQWQSQVSAFGRGLNTPNPSP
jgi:hypothetical protein